MLGEFEYLLLSATARLGEDAYGAAIRREIENSTRRRCSLGAVHTTLDRLEAKGLIERRNGGDTPKRAAGSSEWFVSRRRVSGRRPLFTTPWSERAVVYLGKRTESRHDHHPNLLVVSA
jgi:Transcriptional regulator PadR-like family